LIIEAAQEKTVGLGEENSSNPVRKKNGGRGIPGKRLIADQGKKANGTTWEKGLEG